jgi:hypothetical protein
VAQFQHSQRLRQPTRPRKRPGAIWGDNNSRHWDRRGRRHGKTKHLYGPKLRRSATLQSTPQRHARFGRPRAPLVSRFSPNPKAE